MTELLVLVLVAVSSWFCFLPYLRGKAQVEGTSRSDTPVGRLQQRKETLLQGIAELDFEYNMAKISREDYESLRANMKMQAMETLEDLDLFQQSNSLVTGRKGSGAERRSRSTVCPKCQAVLSPHDRFCSSCGAQVGGDR